MDIALGGTIFLFSNGSWTSSTQVNSDFISHLADMNGDGKLDLITQGVNSGLRLYLGDGGGSETGWQLVDVGLPDASYVAPEYANKPKLKPMAVPYGLEVADVNGNGNLDIIRSYQLKFRPHLLLSSPATIIDVWMR